MPKNVKLPDGSIVAFPDNMDDDAIGAAIKANQPAAPSQHPILDAASDFGKGLLKSGVSTISAADDFAAKHLPAWFTTPIGQAATPENSARAVAATKQLATPTNTVQSIGKGIGNAAQFLIPGAGEDAAASMLAPKIGGAASKIATSALGSGIVNKAQGGSFLGGAATGAAGTGAAQALKAWAPHVAESALSILAPQRMNGRTVGAAILNDTKGIKPVSVMNSAQDAIGNYTDQLHTLVNQSQGNPFNMAPARTALQDGINNIGISQNSPTAMRDLIQANDQLHYKVDPRPFSTDYGKLNYSDPIPAQVTPMEGLQYKRGINHLVDNWAKSGGSPADGAIKQTYGALDAELDRTVPGASQIDQKISSLMPVVDRAKMKAASAPTTQQLFNKLAAPTGALVAPVAGGIYGHEHGGAGGAIAGAAAGAMLPALLATPTGQMALARGLYSGTLSNTIAPLVRGAALTTGRSLLGGVNPENK